MSNEPIRISQLDHLEAALSNAAIRAGIDLNDRQWNTLCTVTRDELQERGIKINADWRRNG